MIEKINQDDVLEIWKEKINSSFDTINSIYSSDGGYYFSQDLDWDNSKTISIPSVEPSSQNKTISTYTAEKNCICYIYVQTEASSVFGGIYLNVISGDTGFNRQFNTNAVAGTNTATALTREICLNKGDTLQVNLSSGYSKVIIGSILVVPYKYDSISARMLRQIGEIWVYSGLDEPNGNKRCNGQVISGIGSFSRYAKVKKWIDDGNCPTCTLEEYESDIATYGQCGKYVYDESADTLKLPTLTRYIRATNESTEIGTSGISGLPNIAGTLGAAGAVAWQTGTGAIYLLGETASVALGGDGSYQQSSHLAFDASRSSAVYGRSDEVVPPHVKYPFLVHLWDEDVETYKQKTVKPQLDWNGVEVKTIESVNRPETGASVFVSYTAPKDGIVTVWTIQKPTEFQKAAYVQYKIISESGKEVIVSSDGPSIWESESTISDSLSLQNYSSKQFSLNKGDTLVGNIDQYCLGISSGELKFIPFKYENFPVTSYTQGELAAIAADASQPDFSKAQVITTPLSEVDTPTPGNGWIHVRLIDPSLLGNKLATFGLTCGHFGIDNYGYNPSVILRCAENSIFTLFYSGIITVDNLRVSFIPVKGAGKLYSQTYTQDEIAEIAAWAASPSNKYIEFSGNEYIAPGNGFIHVIGFTSSSNDTEKFVQIQIWDDVNDTAIMSQTSEKGTRGTYAGVTLNISKGQKAVITTNMESIYKQRFIYANGSV